MPSEETEQSDTTFKNAGISKGHCRVCGHWWMELSTKNCWSPKQKDGPLAKVREKEIEIKSTSKKLKLSMKGLSMKIC